MEISCKLFIFMCVLFWASQGGVSYADEYNRLFRDAGLVWMEYYHGTMDFHYVNLTSDTWEKHGSKLNSKIIARTDKFSFTHIDVAVGLNKTFVMVDDKGRKIVAFSFNAYGQFKPWVLFQGTSSKVNGIAIDWVTEVVYWTDAAYDVIMVSSLMYPHYAEVLVDNLDEPYGIAVHPKKGFLFWTDTDPYDPRLMRSSLGGRKVEVVLQFFSGLAKTLHVDVLEDRLYWLFDRMDGGGQSIGSCGLFGQSRVEAVVDGNHRYFDLDLFRGQMIFVNQDNNELHFFSKERSDKYSNLVLETGYKHKMDEIPFGLRVVDTYAQRTDGNPCLLSGCPGICTMSNFTEDCFCVDALKREAYEEEIRMYCGAKPFSGLLLPKGDGVFTIWNNFGEHPTSLPESIVKPKRLFGEDMLIKAITSDVRSMKIYFFDYYTKAIKSVRTEEGSEPEVVSLAIGNVEGLAFDGVSKTLYWTDSRYGHIMVTNEFGEHPYVLHGGLEEPTQIVINPLKRILYWTEKRTGYMKLSLKSSYLDGTNVTRLLDFGSRRITGMAIDFKTNMIYMCTRTSILQLAQSLDDDTYTYTIVYRNNAHYLTGITVMHDFLVVTDTAYKTSGLISFERPTSRTRLRRTGSAIYPNGKLGNFYGVLYHHISNQPDRMSLCTIRKAGCEQLCLSGRRNVRCVCGLGFITNGSRCEIEKLFNPFLFVADQRYGKLFHVHAIKRRFVAIPVQGLQQPYAVTYDPVVRKVYWSDLSTNTISRSDVDGHNQEVVIYDPDSYFVCLELDPGSRLLFYISRHRFSSSLYVYNVDTERVLNILNRTLGDPRSMHVNVENGYIFLIEQGNLWRLDLNGTILYRLIHNLKATAVASVGQHIFFTDTSKDGKRLYIRRSDLDGVNATVFMSVKHAHVRDLTIDPARMQIYWANSTTKAIYKRPLIGDSRRIEQVGPAHKLMRPAGLFLNNVKDSYDSPCTLDECGGLCLPYGDETICKEAIHNVIDIETGRDIAGLCVVPSLMNGDILNNKAGRVVPHGYILKAQCYPQHTISSDVDVTCRYGQWTHIPTCDLDYRLCGTPEKGYKVYRDSGFYFAYPGVTRVEVICIGGGGGGYDSWNDQIVDLGKAGDGGNSSFGDYLISGEGYGGTQTEGGAGGFGHESGGRGRYTNGSCVTGGTAGEVSRGEGGGPGYTDHLFCGSGGYSARCKNTSSAKGSAGPGGEESNLLSAGNFGGGAGSRMGGTGGGGGWSRLTVKLAPKEVVPVTVGHAGYPSYGHPGLGVVVVMWGGFRADGKRNIIDRCIFD